MSPEQVAWLEERCDEVNEGLPPLTSFVLAGGTPARGRSCTSRAPSAGAPSARRSRWPPASRSGATALQYLNRLSDLLFLLARAANPPGGEVLWVPGGERG